MGMDVIVLLVFALDVVRVVGVYNLQLNVASFVTLSALPRTQGPRASASDQAETCVVLMRFDENSNEEL